ncbi:response regulator transcription factor [Lentzea sp. E54]|uniref:helix-turn-helix transcriptional regulator n=1 Tax=Lentzea xerophila TaxID=3435883 RepID=UPI003DA223C3
MRADGVARSRGDAGGKRVGLLSSCPLLATGVAQAVAADHRLEWVGVVPDVRRAIELCIVCNVDVLVVDLDSDVGTYGCRLLAGMFREVRVTALLPARGSAKRELDRVFADGCADLVPRDCEVSAVLDLLAAAGHRQDNVVTDLRKPPPTRQQLEVLRLCAEGLPNSEIAYRLGLSDDSVRRNLRTALRKLRDHETALLVARALRPDRTIGVHAEAGFLPDRLAGDTGD